MEQTEDSIDINGVIYARGIVQRAAGTIEFTLDQQYDVFHACIGISKLASDPNCGVSSGDARFRVLGDDNHVLREWEVKTTPTEATCFEVIITGTMTMTLETDLNGSQECDIATWADAKVSSNYPLVT